MGEEVSGNTHEKQKNRPDHNEQTPKPRFHGLLEEMKTFSQSKPNDPFMQLTQMEYSRQLIIFQTLKN